jgi:hypothetical protein
VAEYLKSINSYSSEPDFDYLKQIRKQHMAENIISQFSQLNSRLSIHLNKEQDSDDELDEDFYFRLLKNNLAKSNTAKTPAAHRARLNGSKLTRDTEVASCLEKILKKYSIKPNVVPTDKEIKSDLGFYNDNERKRLVVRCSSQLAARSKLTVKTSMAAFNNYERRAHVIKGIEHSFSHAVVDLTVVSSLGDSRGKKKAVRAPPERPLTRCTSFYFELNERDEVSRSRMGLPRVKGLQAPKSNATDQRMRTRDVKKRTEYISLVSTAPGMPPMPARQAAPAVLLNRRASARRAAAGEVKRGGKGTGGLDLSVRGLHQYKQLRRELVAKSKA